MFPHILNRVIISTPLNVMLQIKRLTQNLAYSDTQHNGGEGHGVEVVVTLKSGMETGGWGSTREKCLMRVFLSLSFSHNVSNCAPGAQWFYELV